MHTRLYNKPHLGVGAACTLALTGSFDTYRSGIAYSSAIQASGGNGNIRIVAWNGELPPGASVDFDVDTKQVIVSWPAYAPGTVGDFSNLDFSNKAIGWTLGAGFSWAASTVNMPSDIIDGNVAPGEMVFADYGGESASYTTLKVAAQPGRLYSASVDIQRGLSDEHQAGGAMRILFFDADGNQAAGLDGNVVKYGSKVDWQVSTVSLTAPANAATVQLGLAAFRRKQNYSVQFANVRWNGAIADPSKSVGTNVGVPIPFSVTVADDDNCRATWNGVISGVTVGTIADLDFESGDFTDKTGRVWTVVSGTVVDRWNAQPVVEPRVAANPAGSGLVMTKCPDTANHDGTYDYTGADNLGLESLFGSAAPGAGKDFWIEMDVRMNLHRPANGNSQSFACFGTDKGLMTLGARLGASAPMENTVGPTTLKSTLSLPPNLVNGAWFHFEMGREGDVLWCKYNGVKYAAYTGASAFSVRATDGITIGNGQGSSGTTLGWPGQFDNIKVTVAQ